jgi:hypothetical protein
MVLQRNQWNVSVILVGRASHEPPAPQGGRNPNASHPVKGVRKIQCSLARMAHEDMRPTLLQPTGKQIYFPTLQPPSIRKSVPVTNEDSSDARYKAAWAISTGLAILPNACVDAIS